MFALGILIVLNIKIYDNNLLFVYLHCTQLMGAIGYSNYYS